MSDPRLMGQEVTIRFTKAGAIVNSIDAIGSFNDSVLLEIKESAFLGEPENRYEEVLNGYSFNLEFQVSNAQWLDMQEAIIARARRETPDVKFSVVRVDKYSNGDTAVITYMDVKFGAQPTSIASRQEYVKVSIEGRCSKRTVKKNGLI